MAVNKFPDEVEAIRKLLANNTDGLSIKACATTLGMNRNSVAKYLDMLQMQGRVTVRQYGSARIYTLANKLPVTAILKISKGYVLIFSQGQTVVDINEPFREFLQLPKNDLLGKTPGQLPFFLESHPDLSRLIRDGLKGKETRISAVLVLPDQSLPGTFTFSPVFFENGDPGVALIADITTGTRYPIPPETGADRLLVELDEVEYICRFKPDGTLTYVNRAYGELQQKQTADLIGHEWRPAVPDSEYKKIKNGFSSLNPARPVASLEFRTITPNGESRWQRWKFRGVFNQDGQTTGYQGTGLDITEVKKLEEKVSRDESELEKMIKEHMIEIQDLNKQIYTEISTHEKADFQLQFTQFAMNNASYMIIWISREARFVYMNKKARQVLGYSYRELIVKNFQDLLAENLPLPWDGIWETTRRDHQYTFETAIRARNGHEIPVEIVLNYLEFKEKQYCCCFATDITGRKLAENALMETERRLEDIINFLPDATFAIDRQGKVIAWNRAIEEMTGVRAEEMLGHGNYGYALPFYEKCRPMLIDLIMNPDPEVLNTYSAVQRDGDVLMAETARTNPDGNDLHLWAKTTLLKNASGEIIGAIESIRDITGRKEAETAVQENEEKYRTLVENLPQKIFLKDKKSVYISCNRNYATDLKIHADEISGKTDYDFFPPDLAEKYRADDKRLMASGRTEELIEEYELDGKKYWITTVKTPLKDTSGNTTGILGIFWDMTENKRAQEALLKSEEKYRALVETTGTGYVILDKDGRVMTANQEYLRFTGRSTLAAIEGRPVTDWTAPYDRERNAREVEQCFWKGLVRGLEIDYQKPDGTIQPIEINASVIQSGSGQIILTVCQDITERKRVETALKESECKYRTLVENIPEKIFVKDASLAYVSCNDLYARDLGIAADAIAGKTDFDFYPRDMAEKYRADDRAVMESGAARRIEERYIIQGKESWVSTLKSPIRDDTGNVSGVLGIFSDITLCKTG